MSNKLNDLNGLFLSALEFGYSMTQLRFSFFGKARRLCNFEFWLSVDSRKGVFMHFCWFVEVLGALPKFPPIKLMTDRPSS